MSQGTQPSNTLETSENTLATLPSPINEPGHPT